MAKWKLALDKPDRYGRKQVRTVNLTIDIRDFRDRAGFAWLVIAANPHLSSHDIREVLLAVGDQHNRPHGWVSRHRWLFHGNGAPGRKANVDGLDARAHKIMGENPSLSARKLAQLLRKKGIIRSAEWVRENRVAN